MTSNNPTILDIVNILQNNFNQNYSKIEYYTNSDWLKINFNMSRSILFDNLKIITDMLDQHQLGYKLSSSWEWKDRTYNQISYRNPDRTYDLYVSYSTTTDMSLIDTISDTTDELYECGLFNLIEAMSSHNPELSRKNLGSFSNYTRTKYGFYIDFYNKRQLDQFYEANCFNKIMNVTTEYENKEKIHRCHIYMDDKIPEDIVPYDI